MLQCQGCGVEHDDPEACPTCNQRNPEPAPKPAKPARMKPVAKAKKSR